MWCSFAVRDSRRRFVLFLAVFLAQPLLWGVVHGISDGIGLNQQWRVDVPVSVVVLALLVWALAERYRATGRSPLWALAQGTLLLASALAAWWGFAGGLGASEGGWHPLLGVQSGWSDMLAFGGLSVGVLDFAVLTACGLWESTTSHEGRASEQSDRL